MIFTNLCLIIIAFSIQSCLAIPTSNITGFPHAPQSISNDSSVFLTQGWTASPSGRGSIDILWSCLVTISLCSWSVLCLQVPGPHDSRLTILWRRLWLTALCGVGPEFTFQIALGQMLSARRSVRDFRNADYADWTMRHAFYADSGGFLLQTPDFKVIPIDAKQLLYLITNRYVEYPQIRIQDIRDKNKVDDFLRLISVGQIIWFSATMIARAAQGLEITGMELTTAAFIVCSLGTTFCWWNKGADVAAPITLTTKTTMVDILKNAKYALPGPYQQTPLDFISRHEWYWSRYWKHWINILRNMRIVFAPKTLPFDRLENTDWKELKRGGQAAFYTMSLAYTAIFLAAWNNRFPTDAEKIIWRIASLSMVATVPLFFSITAFAYEVYPALERYFRSVPVLSTESQRVEISSQALPENKTGAKDILSEESISSQSSYKHTNTDLEKSEEVIPSNHSSRNPPRHCSQPSILSRIAAHIRNNSLSKDPSLSIPLKATLPMYLVGFFYCSSRMLILTLDITQLRSLPKSAFDTVDWGAFLPHFS
ncbi:hypothetical protein sscle_09g074300 [Sclerotinia sclerotiorum 1980 UF-70]|uniref:Wax synthase domain-containing protein n=1 Tax=Sclerotinia sclerotiorum (strain ATCC 18683 / 1980 / Ss-1) TaxID=665079 RepID=A0A1D9QCI6_SCLS1|nr:hypothetical protein sscle_09g074300 [Sclerotinia sclerotiorum 1980 UF-70]